MTREKLRIKHAEKINEANMCLTPKSEPASTEHLLRNNTDWQLRQYYNIAVIKLRAVEK